MARYSRPKDSLDRHSLAPSKRFGQNFLVNQRTAEAIVRAANISAGEVVVEVGVGLGALTMPLAGRAAKVIGIEIDSGIIRLHQEEGDLPENVELIHADILKADFGDLAGRCGGKIKIIANLPYSISNPFIFKLIENRESVDRVTVMLQKEVAERLMARPGTKEYGIPSVLLQCCATIRKVMVVKPAEFHPRPKIDSMVVNIDFTQGNLLSVTGEAYTFPVLQRIVRLAFNQRRKTLLNTLGNGWFSDSQGQGERQAGRLAIQKALAQAGVDPSSRPESLDLQDFIRLAIALAQLNGQSGACLGENHNSCD